MKEKKHIDRLFQESFKDFEPIPSDVVWSNIEAKLNQKKKRRIIPLWWKYSGVAALLLLMLTLGNLYFDNLSTKSPNQVVEIEDQNPKKTQDKKENILINNDSNTITENNSKENAIQEEKNNNPLDVDAPKNNHIANTSFADNPVNEENQEYYSVKKTNRLNHSLSQKNNITVNVSEEKSISGSSPNPTNNLNKDVIVFDDVKNKTEPIAHNKNEKNENIDEVDKNMLTIEEALDKTKDVIEEDSNSNKWSIAPNVGPVYFNTLGEGSSIDPQFNDNSKTGELNMSYGISASYAVNKKLSIRSGINKVNLGYNTNNIVVFQTVGVSSSSSLPKNLDSNNSTNNISLISGELINSNAGVEALVTQSNTSINQALGYIEIPLEIQYAISNKKIGVNVIGGFSSLFLNKNEIFSEFEGKQTRLGEATNINNVSYSANFGFGLNYKVTKKINLNLEPIFKYQINTFNNTSGNFKPYFIGVYTGFGFKF